MEEERIIDRDELRIEENYIQHHNKTIVRKLNNRKVRRDRIRRFENERNQKV